MLNKEAIEHIQETAHIPDMIKDLNEHNTHVPTMLKPDNYKVIGLEQYMEHRSNYRLSFETISISDYIVYCLKFKAEGATCFIDQEYMAAVTCFDLGTIDKPGHQQHNARLQLKTTAPYQAILNSNQELFSQRKMVEFFEDWSENIEIRDKSGDVMEFGVAMSRIRDMTIESVKEFNSKVDDFSESMSVMERVEAKRSYSLPSTVTFTCNPYLHFQAIDFTLKISIDTNSGKPQLKFRIMRLDAIKEQIAFDFKSFLDADFSKKIATYLGVLNRARHQ